MRSPNAIIKWSLFYEQRKKWYYMASDAQEMTRLLALGEKLQKFGEEKWQIKISP